MGWRVTGADCYLYSRLRAAQNDMVHVQACVEHLLEREWLVPLNWWAVPEGEGHHLVAMTIGMLIAYSRPFRRSSEMPRLPPDLIDYTAKEFELHDKLLQLRNVICDPDKDFRWEPKRSPDGRVRMVKATRFFEEPFTDPSLFPEEARSLYRMTGKLQARLQKRILELGSPRSPQA